LYGNPVEGDPATVQRWWQNVRLNPRKYMERSGVILSLSEDEETGSLIV